MQEDLLKLSSIINILCKFSVCGFADTKLPLREKDVIKKVSKSTLLTYKMSLKRLMLLLRESFQN